jgi:hypothetical protein
MVVNRLVLILDFVAGVPTDYRALFLAPSVGITNIMACRVFRRTKLHRHDEDAQDVSKIAFRAGSNTPVFVHSSQMGGLTTGSVLASDIHTSSITDTVAQSGAYHSSDKLPYTSKETVGSAV